jgi:hypothetical protein
MLRAHVYERFSLWAIYLFELEKYSIASEIGATPLSNPVAAGRPLSFAFRGGRS